MRPKRINTHLAQRCRSKRGASLARYARWLDAYERRSGEEAPIGLILCSHKGPQQTALLGLDSGEIRASQYLTEPLRNEMQRRLAAVAAGATTA